MNRTQTLVLAVVLATPVSLAAQADNHQSYKGKMFEMADTNKDGTVSREEFMNFRHASAGKRFDMMDANKDGRLSKEEAAAAKAKFKQMMEERRAKWAAEQKK